MGFGPFRSSTKSPGRSITRSLRLEIESEVQPPEKPEPYPIPGRQLYCLAGFQAENSAMPPGTQCRTSNPCPDNDPGSWEGDWVSWFETTPDMVPDALVPENYPVNNTNDSQGAACVNYWNSDRPELIGPIVFALRRNTWDDGRGVNDIRACSVGSLGQAPQGEYVSLSMATARWTITAIDAVNDRIYVDGPTNLYATGPDGRQPMIAVSGQPKNNGYWTAFIVNDAEGWIEVTGSLQAEPAGGQVTFQPAIATVCGDYTSVIDACQSIRIYCNPAGITKQMHLVFFKSAVYDATPRPVTGIGPDYVEVFSGFDGNDSGIWGAGLWTFNERGDRITGSFTAVTDPPDIFPAEVRAYTGPELNPSEPDDLILRITDSTGYDGDQPVTPDKPFTTPYWRYDTQLYVGPSTGNWANKAVTLVGGFLLSNKPGRVTGTLGLYDGLYFFVRSAPTGGGAVLPNRFFVGNDTGVIEFQELYFIADGGTSGYNQPNSTVVISGTGLYDGTYTGVQVTYFELPGFPSVTVLEGGDLDSVWYAGDVFTGTYEVISGEPLSGNIIESGGDGPAFFTSAEPEKGGTIPATQCIGYRVSVGSGHGIEVGDYFEMFANTVYTSLCFGTVTAIYSDGVDIQERTFEGTDAGLWNATK